MGNLNVRLTVEEERELQAYMGIHKIDNRSKALRRKLDERKEFEAENKRLREENERLNQQTNNHKENVPDCIHRIQVNGKNKCVHKPPKAVPLETLEICIVCKKMKFGLTEKTIKSPLAPNSLLTHEQEKKYKPYIPPVLPTVHCEWDGDNHIQRYCEGCKRDTPDRFEKCKPVKQFRIA